MTHHHRLGLAGFLGPVLFFLGQTFFALVFRTIWRRRLIGVENVPRQGPLVLASNHISNADPPIVGSSVCRRTYFMAKQELFDVPLFGWLIKQCNAFPIRRLERDLGAFKMSLRILAAGQCLMMFPEGTRQKSGQLGKVRPGVGLLAMRGAAPVVPVYIHNSNRLSHFDRITVVFGQPLPSTDETDPQVFSEKIMDAIRGLKEAHFPTGQ